MKDDNAGIMNIHDIFSIMPVAKNSNKLKTNTTQNPIKNPLNEKFFPGIHGSNIGVMILPAKRLERRFLAARNPVKIARSLEYPYLFKPDNRKKAAIATIIYFPKLIVSTRISTRRSYKVKLTCAFPLWQSFWTLRTLVYRQHGQAHKLLKNQIVFSLRMQQLPVRITE